MGAQPQSKTAATPYTLVLNKLILGGCKLTFNLGLLINPSCSYTVAALRLVHDFPNASIKMLVQRDILSTPLLTIHPFIFTGILWVTWATLTIGDPMADPPNSVSTTVNASDPASVTITLPSCGVRQLFPSLKCIRLTLMRLGPLSKCQCCWLRCR